MKKGLMSLGLKVVLKLVVMTSLVLALSVSSFARESKKTSCPLASSSKNKSVVTDENGNPIVDKKKAESTKID